MALLTRHGDIVADDWVRLDAEFDTAAPLPPGKLLVPLCLWNARHAELVARDQPVGIWLASSEHPEAIVDALEDIALVAIDFPVFSDGRGYSYARVLRDTWGFAGELRAIGDVQRDQIFLMKRCGFDSFQIRADRDPTDALAGLEEFSLVYQSATVDPLPPLLQREVRHGA